MENDYESTERWHNEGVRHFSEGGKRSCPYSAEDIASTWWYMGYDQSKRGDKWKEGMKKMKFNVDDLIAKKLVTAKVSPCGEYRLLKYHRRVFYDNLWKVDPRIVQCRGIVVDKNDNVVLYGFDKIFNYGENKTGINLNHNEIYRAVEKRNGFLAQVGMVDGKMLVTSSGSFDGEHRTLAGEVIRFALFNKFGTVDIDLPKGYTFMFEICDPADPHIVHEAPGAYLIGMRDVSEGRRQIECELTLDIIAREFGFKRPLHSLMTLTQAVEASRTVKHEGFILRDMCMNTPVLKLKSKHYLNKKALMRMGKNSATLMFSNPNAFKKERLEEEFYDLFDWILIRYTQDTWTVLEEQDRRKLIEGYFNDNPL